MLLYVNKLYTTFFLSLHLIRSNFPMSAESHQSIAHRKENRTRMKENYFYSIKRHIEKMGKHR